MSVISKQSEFSQCMNNFRWKAANMDATSIFTAPFTCETRCFNVTVGGRGPCRYTIISSNNWKPLSWSWTVWWRKEKENVEIYNSKLEPLRFSARAFCRFSQAFVSDCILRAYVPGPFTLLGSFKMATGVIYKSWTLSSNVRMRKARQQGSELLMDTHLNIWLPIWNLQISCSVLSVRGITVNSKVWGHKKKYIVEKHKLEVNN